MAPEARAGSLDRFFRARSWSGHKIAKTMKCTASIVMYANKQRFMNNRGIEMNSRIGVFPNRT